MLFPPKVKIGDLQPDKNHFKAIIMTTDDRPKGFIWFFSKANYNAVLRFGLVAGPQRDQS